MVDWTDTSPLRSLDELAAFDAMRRFLEIWWEVGGRAEDQILNVLSATNRTLGSSQGAPIDPAMWQDWQDAVATVLKTGSALDRDPLTNMR